MGMGTVLLVVLVVGAAVFLRNRPQGSKASKPVESVSARPEEKRDLSAAPMEKKVHPPVSYTHLQQDARREARRLKQDTGSTKAFPTGKAFDKKKGRVIMQYRAAIFLSLIHI